MSILYIKLSLSVVKKCIETFSPLANASIIMYTYYRIPRVPLSLHKDINRSINDNQKIVCMLSRHETKINSIHRPEDLNFHMSRRQCPKIKLQYGVVISGQVLS